MQTSLPDKDSGTYVSIKTALKAAYKQAYLNLNKLFLLVLLALILVHEKPSRAQNDLLSFGAISESVQNRSMCKVHLGYDLNVYDLNSKQPT